MEQQAKDKLVTMKLTSVEVGAIRRALETHRGSVTDTTPVETTMVLVRFRNHDERMKQGY